MQAREGSPPWLAAETRKLRDGLLALYRNVVLLRDAESPHFFPVHPLSGTPQTGAIAHGSCSLGMMGINRGR